MGTNYYLHKKPSKEELISLKEMFDQSVNGTNFSEVLTATHMLFDFPMGNGVESVEGWGKLALAGNKAES